MLMVIKMHTLRQASLSMGIEPIDRAKMHVTGLRILAHHLHRFAGLFPYVLNIPRIFHQALLTCFPLADESLITRLNLVSFSIIV